LGLVDTSEEQKCPEMMEIRFYHDEDHLNEKLHIIQEHEDKHTKECAICSDKAKKLKT
jgi:hypothetical protein